MLDVAELFKSGENELSELAGDGDFSIPKENARDFAAGVYNPETGLVHFRKCTWFTNLDIKKRHE